MELESLTTGTTVEIEYRKIRAIQIMYITPGGFKIFNSLFE